jgi:pimeloyl-ACP methyl ester carboxylesterase
MPAMNSNAATASAPRRTSARRSSPSGHADVEGIRMHYLLRGQGEPLLLLHGFSGAGIDWEPFLPELGRGWRFVLPDLRGHGHSTNPAGTYTFRQSARDVAGLLDHLGIARCKAIGVSGGGNALLHLASAQPERITAMVLVSAAPGYDAGARALMRQHSTALLTADAWLAQRRRHPGGDAQIEALFAQTRLFADEGEALAPEALGRITARTLLVSGAVDPFVPLAAALAMAQAIPRAELWLVPNAGHGPILGARRALFVAMARAFLSSAPDGG